MLIEHFDLVFCPVKYIRKRRDGAKNHSGIDSRFDGFDVGSYRQTNFVLFSLSHVTRAC